MPSHSLNISNYQVNPNSNGIGRGGRPSGKSEYWHFRGSIENHHVSERLLMRQTEDEPFVGYIYQGSEHIYTDNTIHTLLLSEEGRKFGITYRYLLAILNSNTLRQIYHAMTQEEGRTLAQVKTAVANRLPILLSTPDELESLDSMVANIQGIYEVGEMPLTEETNAQVATIQHDIDEYVARLYGLTEVAAIEGPQIGVTKGEGEEATM